MVPMDDLLLDWLHLPAGEEAVSLWCSLHDARLHALNSDRRNWTLVMTLDVPHLRKYRGLPDDFRFLLQFDAVKSVRACAFVFWPGEFSLPSPLPIAEQERLMNEYYRKGREQSVDWDQMEASLTDEDAFHITDADLAENEGIAALRLMGYHDNGYQYLFIRGGTLTLSGSDGRKMNLQEFLKWGMEYWERFDRRQSGDTEV